MKATKITGNTRALRVVVTAGRTKTRSRFLTVSVQICLRKRFNMVACSSISLRSSSSIPGEVRVSFKIEIDEPRSHCDYYRNILRLAQDGNQTDDVQATSAQDGGDWCFLDFPGTSIYVPGTAPAIDSFNGCHWTGWAMYHNRSRQSRQIGLAPRSRRGNSPIQHSATL